MRQPAVYTPYEMQNWTTSEEFAPGIYRSARPLNFMWSFSRSLYVAWQVFLGRWDALNWNSTQGYERKSYPSDQEKYVACWRADVADESQREKKREDRVIAEAAAIIKKRKQPEADGPEPEPDPGGKGMSASTSI